MEEMMLEQPTYRKSRSKKHLKTFLQLLNEFTGMRYNLWDYNQKKTDAKKYVVTDVVGGAGSRVILMVREIVGKRFSEETSITLEDMRSYILNLDGKRIEILNRDYVLNLSDAIIGYDEVRKE